MGKIFLCKEIRAKNPFFIRCIEKNVYTIEELCFFFYHEIYFVEEFHDWAELAAWLKRELKLESLSKEIQKLTVGYDTKLQMVLLILESVHYRSGEELLEYERKMEEIHKSAGFLRNKKKADYLVHENKYNQAIELYLQILNSDNKPEEEIAADVYHNLGVIYAKLFYFEKAADFFLESFKIAPTTESLKQYKLALKLGRKEEKADECVLDLPSVKQLDLIIDDEIQAIDESVSGEANSFHKLDQLKKSGKVSEYYDNIQKILMNWKEECRSYM